jgi:hypothetical protein
MAESFHFGLSHPQLPQRLAEVALLALDVYTVH